MESAPFKIEKGELVGFIEKDGYYVTGIVCRNCGKRYGAVYVKKGITQEEYMHKIQCDECGCLLV
jgi:hypothetical protein